MSETNSPRRDRRGRCRTAPAPARRRSGTSRPRRSLSTAITRRVLGLFIGPASCRMPDAAHRRFGTCRRALRPRRSSSADGRSPGPSAPARGCAIGLPCTRSPAPVPGSALDRLRLVSAFQEDSAWLTGLARLAARRNWPRPSLGRDLALGNDDARRATACSAAGRSPRSPRRRCSRSPTAASWP